jgi:hypothetical protein
MHYLEKIYRALKRKLQRFLAAAILAGMAGADLPRLKAHAQTDPNSYVPIWNAVTMSSSTNSADIHSSAGGGRFFLWISSASGTSPTIIVKIQSRDPLSGSYIDLLSASFAQYTGTVAAELTVYPGIATAANQAVSYVLSGDFRAVATIGGTSPSFTVSLSFVPLW